MSIHPSSSGRLRVCVAVCAMCLFAAQSVLAADCGCEIACDSCPIEAGGCDCGYAKPKKLCCLSDGFRKLSDSSSSGFCKLRGHFKKLCSGWKLCGHGESLCDDACDAALFDDLMQPSSEVIYHDHVHTQQNSMMRQHHSSVPIEKHLQPADSRAMPAPVRIEETEVDAELFNTLPDPFLDDEARTTTRNTIRPSSHDEVVLRPVPKRPLSHSYESSSRRSSSLR